MCEYETVVNRMTDAEKPEVMKTQKSYRFLRKHTMKMPDENWLKRELFLATSVLHMCLIPLKQTKEDFFFFMNHSYDQRKNRDYGKNVSY